MLNHLRHHFAAVLIAGLISQAFGENVKGATRIAELATSRSGLLALCLYSPPFDAYERKHSQVVVVDLKSGEVKFRVANGSSPQFSRKGKSLFVLRGVCDLETYSTETWKLVDSTRLPMGDNPFIESPAIGQYSVLGVDERYVAFSDRTGALNVFDKSRQKVAKHIAGNTDAWLKPALCGFEWSNRFLDVRFTQDHDRRILHSVVVHDAAADSKPTSIPYSDNGIQIVSAMPSPDGKCIVFLYRDYARGFQKDKDEEWIVADSWVSNASNQWQASKEWRIWKLPSGTAAFVNRNGGIAFSTDSSTMAIVAKAKAVELIRADDKKLLREFISPGPSISCVALGGDYLVAGTDESEILIWNTARPADPRRIRVSK